MYGYSVGTVFRNQKAILCFLVTFSESFFLGWWFVMWLCVAEMVHLWVVQLIRRWSNCACLACAAWRQATLPAWPCGCQCRVARPGAIGLSSYPCPPCRLHFHHLVLSAWPKRLLPVLCLQFGSSGGWVFALVSSLDVIAEVLVDMLLLVFAGVVLCSSFSLASGWASWSNGGKGY